MMWLKNNLKLLYLDNRPNIVSKDIKGILCRCEFGKPSGTLINTTTILMYVVWDLFSRCHQLNLKLRFAMLGVGKLIVLQIFFTVMYMGLHSYNQMLYSVLVSMTYFYVCAYYEEYLLRFWHTLIDHSLAPRLRRRLMWVSTIITVLAVGIYVGILLGQWDKKDFTVALEGACPNCAYTNWCWETIYQDTSMLGFPCAVIALSLRSHEWKPNANYLRQQLGFRGLFRLVISFICWLPVIVYYWPAYTGVPARICATPWKNLIATCLTWIALP
jgi:hypothetical protein